MNSKLIQCILMVVLIVAFTAGSAMARKSGVGIGLKAGINVSNTSGDNWFTNTNGITQQAKKSRVGLIGGGYLTLNLSSSFSIEPELLFTQKGAKYSGYFNQQAFELETRLNYLEIPVLFQFNLMPEASSTPKIFAGPVVSLKMSGTTTHPSLSGITFPTDDDFSKVDWGTVMGAGVDFGTGGLNLSLEARYTIGLQNLTDTNTTALNNGTINLKNGVASVLLGIGFQP